MQSLHHRHAVVPAGRIGAGRDQGKGVVEMGHIRLAAADQRGHIVIALPRPGPVERQRPAPPQGRLVDMVVVPLERDDLVARPLQQGPLAAKGDILAAGGGGPVVVVGEKYFQG